MKTTSTMRRFGQLSFLLLLIAAHGCAIGAPDADSTVGSVQQAVVTGDVGFVFADNLFSNSYDAAPGSSYNNHGGTNHVTVLSAGKYRVDFPGLGGTGGGHVQVMPYGLVLSEHPGGTHKNCVLSSWSESGTTLQVFVNCFSFGGSVPSGSKFMVAFQRRSGNIGAEGGYAFANDANAASYTPDSRFQWNSAGGSITIQREGHGRYLVNFPNQTASNIPRAFEVTPYGAGNINCNPAPGPSSTQVRVRCYTAAGGGPLDTKFTVAYSTRSPNNAPTYTFATVVPGSPSSFVSSSYGAVASQCGPDQPIGTFVSAGPGSLQGGVRVHFPQLSTFSSYNIMAFAYDTTARYSCQVTSQGIETGGAFANVICMNDDFGFAPLGTKFVIVFSSTIATFC